MDQNTTLVLFALIRSAVFDVNLSETEKGLVSNDVLDEINEIAQKHDVSHLISHGLRKNSIVSKKDDTNLQHTIFTAAMRHERLNWEFSALCDTLESAQISFLPLKGSVLCNYYPEPWMRTRCDIDILVRKADFKRASSCLTENLSYIEQIHSTHDISLFSPTGVHVELHFDLVEEGRANHAIHILDSVWDDASLCKNSAYQYKMSDAFFYFYHIAHMAKHFETGGCGIRPFIDLYILDNLQQADSVDRDALLQKGDLLNFAQVSRKLSQVWFQCEASDAIMNRMQNYILQGGAYGSVDNRVALQQQKKGGRYRYALSRVFIPHEKLKRYYPILEKHSWLSPIMQIKRWTMLLKPDIAKRTKRELIVNSRIKSTQANDMELFLTDIGLGKRL